MLATHAPEVRRGGREEKTIDVAKIPVKAWARKSNYV